MSWLTLPLGLLLPWITGAVLSDSLLRPRAAPRPGVRSLMLGIGGLGGMLMSAAVTYLWGIAGLSYTALPMLVLWLLVTVGVLWVLRQRLADFFRGSSLSSEPAISISARIVLTALLVLIALHVAVAAFEIIVRPLFPWDATSAWATKAKVWSSLGQWVEFVSKDAWLASDSGQVYTDHRPDYPIVVPLVQLWSAILVGHWHLSLVNLPWLVCYLSLLLAFFGAARLLDADRVTATVFTYFLASLPLLSTHVALAGYGDLLMATTWFAAFLTLQLWSRQRSTGSFLCMVMLAAACAMVKNEGLFWAAALIPGILFVALPRLVATGACAFALIAGAGLATVLPEDTAVAGHSLGQLALGLRPDALKSVLISQFNLSSWHLLFPAFALAVAASFRLSASSRTQLAPAAVTLLVAYLFLFALFLFTGYAPGALNYTAVSRINLALVPATLFWSMQVFAAAAANWSRA